MVFDPAMYERMRQTQEVETELRQALAGEQLRLVYQPLLRLCDRDLVGVEALLRWRHPRRGELLPGEFLTVADECGLLGEIGDRMLVKACDQFAAWRQHWGKRAPPLLVVNLTRTQLRQPGLVPEVLAVLKAHGMEPAQLQLDLAEGGIAGDAQALAALRALRAAGVRLALDDFGSGQTSLSRLAELPVDTVKIDSTLVARAIGVESQRVLIGATLRVAAQAGMVTVAEGVETEEQAALLSQLGCDLAQGRLFGRPLSAEGIDRWIERDVASTVR
jgi:EAL domain-containing protein (putative c-di-GMP-specific phosphodiesterase class I)